MGRIGHVSRITVRHFRLTVGTITLSAVVLLGAFFLRPRVPSPEILIDTAGGGSSGSTSSGFSVEPLENECLLGTQKDMDIAFFEDPDSYKGRVAMTPEEALSEARATGGYMTASGRTRGEQNPSSPERRLAQRRLDALRSAEPADSGQSLWISRDEQRTFAVFALQNFGTDSDPAWKIVQETIAVPSDLCPSSGR